MGVIDERTWWSVLGKGTADEVHGGEVIRRLTDLPLRLWAPGENAGWIRISPVEVSGRRIRPAASGPSG